MRGLPRFRTSAVRRGLSSMIVIGFTLVIFIVFARLVYMLKEGAFMASHFHRRGILANVADGGAAVGLNVLDLLFGDPTSEPFKSLTEEGKYEDRVFEIYPKGPFKVKCLDELAAKYPGCSLDVKARVFFLKPFGEVFEPGVMKQIRKEKIGVLEVSSAAMFDKPKYKQIVRERRWIKITCQALPVLSRFTLFHQEANKCATPKKFDKLDYSKEWNRIAVSEAGAADGEPLIIASGFTGPFGDPKKRGWVFLGGGEKPKQAILLGLAGGSTKVGEGHHLFPDIFQNSGYRAKEFFGKDWPSFVAELMPSWITDAEQRKTAISPDKAHPIFDFSKTPPTPYPDMTDGFFDSGMCKEIADIPELAELIAWIGTYCNHKDGAASPLSSAIHLLGAQSGVNECDQTPYPPGPTGVVMGNIFRAYAQIGVFQFYEDKSPNPSNRWDITGFWPLGLEGTLKKAVLAGEAAENSTGSTYKRQDHPLYEAFKMEFGVYKDYTKSDPPGSNYSIFNNFDFDLARQHYFCDMSYMIFEPYAASSLWRGKLVEAKLAPKSIDPDWGKDDDCQWGSVLPAKDKSQGLIEREERDFTKTLNKFFLPEKYFTMRETVHYKGENAQKEFEALFKEHIKGGTLNFGKYIVVEGDVNLPDIDKVEKGGVVVATGNISVGKIGEASDTTSDENARCAKLLSIVSLGGTVSLRGGPVNAQILALGSPEDPSVKRDGKDGTLPVPMPFGGTIQGKIELLSKLELTGGLACRELDPADVAKKGGTITYNPMLSPEHDKGYLENNFAYCINLMPKIEEWEVKAE